MAFKSLIISILGIAVLLYSTSLHISDKCDKGLSVAVLKIDVNLLYRSIAIAQFPSPLRLFAPVHPINEHARGNNHPPSRQMSNGIFFLR